MLHIIRIPATCLDMAPLAAVAAAMARSAATAGGTPFHKPTFDGKLAAFERRLVADAWAGRLTVRDQDGGVGSADEIVQRSKGDGTYSEVLTHTGGAVDLDKTLSLVLYVSIPQLNEWGAESGDSFAVDSSGVEWIDERGVVAEALLERTLNWTINGILHSKAPWAPGAREEVRKLEASGCIGGGLARKLAAWLGNRADHYDRRDPASADQIREAQGKLLQRLPKFNSQADAVSSGSPGAAAVAGGDPRVYWLVVLNARIRELDCEHGGKADVMSAIRWFKQLGDRRIPNEGPHDVLTWIDDNETRQTVKKSTVSKRLSDARRTR